MSIAIVETYGTSFRVIGPSGEIISTGGWVGRLMGYSSKFMVWRQNDAVATLDENGRCLGSNSIPAKSEILGITDTGFLVRHENNSNCVYIFGPRCEPLGSRTW